MFINSCCGRKLFGDEKDKRNNLKTSAKLVGLGNEGLEMMFLFD